MRPIIQTLFVLRVLSVVTSFSAPIPSKALAPWQSLLDSLFPTNDGGAAARRSELKDRLTDECRLNIGINTPEIRSRMESIIQELAPLNPTPRTASSPLLRRKWVLEWTSEKEINFFLNRGISEKITQTLSPQGDDVLENYIPFVKGGGFGVTGTIGVDEESEGCLRTKFKFENAKLYLGRWGEYNFPPVGEGWFDTVYLDEGLRVDTNSRNDILICIPEEN